MFKVNDGTDFSADANTITFNVRDLTCAMPSFGTRRDHWFGTVTVGGDDIVGYGFASGTGSLDPNVFSIGSNSYTIDLVTVGADAATRGALSLNLTSSNLTSAEAAALKLHVCDSAGFDFDGNDVDHQDADFSYAWAAAALDWSPPVATRTLYLSLPANQAATGEPTITGTAQVGQALTADASPITDADGLPATFTYQWIRVDEDGTSNEEDISGEIASTYTLTTADVGKKVKVKVSFTDDLSGDEERTSEAYPASATVTAANTATAQGDVWTGTVTVGEIRDFNGFGYVAAPHPLAFTGGSLSDDDFDIDGTTYTVWRITIGTTGTNEARPRFTVATGSPPAVTDLPNKDELVLRLTYGGVIGNFALLDATYTGSGPSSSQGFFWGTRHPTGDYPSRGQTMTVELLFKIAPTAANNTVLTPRNTAYTFTASEFGFADTNAGDTLASVRIVTLPAEGTLALDGTAVTPDQVVTRADIDDKKLIFTPVAGASGDGYASFTFKVNDGIVDSDDAYTMTIDVTVALVAPGPPTGLAATAGGQSRIDLAWTAPANTGGSPITGYRIEVSPDGTSDWTDLVADTASTATTYAHTGLDAATTRHYRVSAINAVGTSVPSGSDDATTETAIPAGVIRVPLDSVLKPADIGAGERFRLMFISSTKRDATSTDIAAYNTFVSTLAAAGVTAVQTYANDFTAVVSTESVNARANTQTRATDTDAPIYWVDRFSIGANGRVADGYADFYDGTWQNTLGLSESGNILLNSSGSAWTGTNTDGTTHATQFMGATGSSPTVRSWQAISGIITATTDAPSTSHHILGLSPVFQVATLANTAPTAANNTVTTEQGAAYTFEADDFGFADTDPGDTLASVRIKTLPAAGTLALAGAAVTTDQVVTKAQIDGNSLTFTPGAGESGDGYASFTFKVNDGTYFSAVAYTMTIDVTPPPITIEADRKKATGLVDWVEYTLTRGGDLTQELTVTVMFEGPVGNDWNLEDSTRSSREVTFDAGDATAHTKRLMGRGFFGIGFDLDSSTSGTLTARLGATAGYDTSDTETVVYRAERRTALGNEACRD